MPDAGQLDHRITFASRGPADPSEPDTGNTEGAFVDRFTVWAQAQYLRGTESVMASRLQGRQPVVFTVRASSQTRCITAEWRARDKRTGITYAIKGIVPGSDRAFLDVLAGSGVAP